MFCMNSLCLLFCFDWRRNEICTLDELLMTAEVSCLYIFTQLLPPLLNKFLLLRTLFTQRCKLLLKLYFGPLLFLDHFSQLFDLVFIEIAHICMFLLHFSNFCHKLFMTHLLIDRLCLFFIFILPIIRCQEIFSLFRSHRNFNFNIMIILYCSENCIYFSSLLPTSKYFLWTNFPQSHLQGLLNIYIQQNSNQLEYYKMNNSKNQTTLAVPFITYQQGIGFSLSKEAEEFLLSLPEERQLGIVSIVGKYRTGKSFFVNRVLLSQKKGGFQVGPTINPCTKGLWLWKNTFASTSNEKMDIIMIDTEGFGGMDENANHDSRIFLFSLLLSSYFIYNSVGSIDQNAINTLNLIINLAKDIQCKSTGRSEADISSFPAFLWVIRDFTLQLEDKNSNKISPEQYLQSALDMQKGTSDAVENKNKIRRLFKSFFTDRDCEPLVRPIEDQRDLQKLDTLDNSKLRPEFVAQIEALRAKIFTKIKAKKVNDKPLNGQLLVALCKGYMDAINKGALPNVESAWFYVCRSQGLRAVKQATELLDMQIKQLLQKPIKYGNINVMKSELKQKILAKFKKRSLNAQESHPDLMQKLEKRFEEGIADLMKKNKNMWEQRYNQATESITQQIKDKIYNDEYEDFSDFVKDFEQIKQRYNQETEDGDPIEKWKYFNQISEHLYRLAGETITTKINKNLHHEKVMMQQRLQRQEEELQNQQRLLEDEKQYLKNKISMLQKQNAKIVTLQDSHKTRALQYKNQHDKLYQKYRELYNDHEEMTIQLDKLKRENKRIAQSEVEETKNELLSIKSTLEKQRALHDMEKKYMEQQIERYKERASTLQTQCRKLRTNNSKLASDVEELQNKYEQKRQEAQILEQTNSSFSKKIENLIAENSKKSELMNDHSEWMLQKSYLQNQISFLKNTLNQNKRLHDALLIALQQSLSSTESEANVQLLQANKNLSSALEKMENRCKVLQEKYDRVKQFKKMMKNCQSMQCLNCSKWIQTNTFSIHMEQCCGSSVTSLREKTAPDFNRQAIQITVGQTIIKQSQDKKKPYTQYVVQINVGQNKWKISKRYKQFTELQQMLINRFPSIKYPPSCNFLADINNLVSSKQRNVMSEQRRKSLQQYLRDLIKIEEIRNSDILKKFLEFPESNTQIKPSKPVKEISEKKERLYL